MARKSRKETKYHTNPVIENKTNIKYYAGLYARISVESQEKIERDSIGTQVALLQDFAKTMYDIDVADVYIDDDISGTNFDRPAYERLMKDIDDGSVNCIIVKDLSRFAREHIGAGEYLEKIFPAKGVRFIAITDNIDTLKNDGGVIVPFKNVINELYAKDASKKIRTNFKTMQKNGQFCSSKAPYGYIRSEKDKHRFEIDSEAASIVRRIFEMFNNKESLLSIARKLQKESIPCPARYAFEKGFVSDKRSEEAKWTSQSVKKIVGNLTYTGDMVQNRYETVCDKNGKNKLKSVEKERWIVVENTHEPIITKDIYLKAQKIIENNIKIAKENRDKHNDIEKVEYTLSGILKCGYCGTNINVKRRFSKKEVNYYYICPVHEVYGKDRCEKIAIKKEIADEVAFLVIKRYMESFLDAEKTLKELNSTNEVKKEINVYQKNINSYNLKIYNVKKMRSNMFQDLSEGLITNSDYAYFSEQYTNEIKKYEKKIEDLSKDLKLYENNFDNESEFKKVIDKYINETYLTKKMAETFFESIIVDNEGSFIMKMKLKDEYNELMCKLVERKGGV